jgi:hypothetical protein
VVRVPEVKKMKPSKRAQDRLGRSQNAFADQNQGDTMWIRPVLGVDPGSTLRGPREAQKPYKSLISLISLI